MKRTTTRTAAAAASGQPPAPPKKKDLRGSPEAIRKRLATMRRNKAKKAKAAQAVRAKKANGAAHVRAARPPKLPKAVGSQRFLAVLRAREHVEKIDQLVEGAKSGDQLDLKELRLSSLLALRELATVGSA